MSVWAQKTGLVSITPREGQARHAATVAKNLPKRAVARGWLSRGRSCWGLAPHCGSDNTNTAHKDLLLTDLLVF